MEEKVYINQLWKGMLMNDASKKQKKYPLIQETKDKISKSMMENKNHNELKNAIINFNNPKKGGELNE